MTCDQSKITGDEVRLASKPYFTGNPILAFFFSPLVGIATFWILIFFGIADDSPRFVTNSVMYFSFRSFVVLIALGLPLIAGFRWLRVRHFLPFAVVGFCLGSLVALWRFYNFAALNALYSGRGSAWDYYVFEPKFFLFCVTAGIATSATFWWLAFRLTTDERKLGYSGDAR